MDESTYRIRIAKTNSGPVYYLNAMPFFRYYGIEHEEAKKYTPEWNQKDELWEVNLNKPLDESKR